MDICDILFQQTEIANKQYNNGIANLVLQDFEKQTHLSFEFEDFDTEIEKLLGIKNYYLDIIDKYKTIFFQLLEKYHYNLKFEIMEAINSLGNLKDPNQNQELIQAILNSPVIQDIGFNGTSTFTIWSEQYGKFVFELASYYFRENKQVMYYIKNNPLSNRCHTHTYVMSKIFADFYAITSLCPFYFQGQFYHSYTLDKDRNTIIDLCHNAIMDKRQYDCLFQPQEISVILGKQVEKELEITLQNTNQKQIRAILLKIVLYKQYLQQIGYQGDIAHAPKIR